MIKKLATTAALATMLVFPALSQAGMEEARSWVADEFQPSTLSKADQLKEMEWFIKAAEPFKGMEIKVVSGSIITHQYESRVLAKAFTEITGIKVRHELIGKGDIIETLQAQMQSGNSSYDAYIYDSDLIGTLFRYQQAVPLTDWMNAEGQSVTNPMLDLDDFIGISFSTGPDGKLYQIPDQQYANLYWFRYDWFTDPELKARFQSEYGYDLGVPVNWSAYEDIAEFFTSKVKEIDGKPVYGHMDYGKKDPSLGWRFTDGWLSMAGAGDKGLPNGVPVAGWGIRVEGCSPVGSSVARGGATNSPAAVYALSTYIDWLQKYAPPEAAAMTFSEAGPVPAQGAVAQQIFWNTAFTTDMARPGSQVVDEEGKPKWRLAPSPHGPYWQEGMKLGYQDAGSWTLLDSTPVDRRKAAWLYAQFVISKSVSLKKAHVGLTPIRESDIRDKSFTMRAPKLGGLVEFYRSPDRVQWTPSGSNVPDYPKLAQLWRQNVADAVSGDKSAQEAMDSLARQQDKVLADLEDGAVQGECGSKLNQEQDPSYWFSQPGSPKPKLENEKPQGITVDYDELVKSWTAAVKQ